jgi:hypothetical protein
VARLRAVPQQRPTRAQTRLERLSRVRLSRASATQGEVSTPARPPRRPSRIEPRPKTPFTTTGAPPGHRISRPQTEARESTKGNSEDTTPRHVARFRRQPRRGPRRPCDSTSSATRAAARFARSREGLIGTMNGLSELLGESTFITISTAQLGSQRGPQGLRELPNLGADLFYRSLPSDPLERRTDPLHRVVEALLVDLDGEPVVCLSNSAVGTLDGAHGNRLDLAIVATY